MKHLRDYSTEELREALQAYDWDVNSSMYKEDGGTPDDFEDMSREEILEMLEETEDTPAESSSLSLYLA